MAMTNGTPTGAHFSINVTPLIDVLLVLLIIFMVIQPAVVRGLDALAPKPSSDHAADPHPRTLVLSVGGGADAPIYSVNGRSFACAELEPALQRIVRETAAPVFFVQGDAGLDYGTIALTLDMLHRAGVSDVALLTPGTAAH